MRTPDALARSLRGQLLRTDVTAELITLDCILATDRGLTGWPVTLVTTLPRRRAAAGNAVRQLRRWAADATPIEVTIATGVGGAHVLVASASKRVVLEPAACAPTSD